MIPSRSSERHSDSEREVGIFTAAADETFSRICSTSEF